MLLTSFSGVSNAKILFYLIIYNTNIIGNLFNNFSITLKTTVINYSKSAFMKLMMILI